MCSKHLCDIATETFCDVQSSYQNCAVVLVEQCVLYVFRHISVVVCLLELKTSLLMTWILVESDDSQLDYCNNF